MASRIRLDHAGIGELLKSEPVAAAVRELGEDVAAVVETDDAVVRHDIPVQVDDYTTDRAAVAVTLAHAAGAGVQATYGTLTRAAGALGLEVTERKPDG